MKPGRLLVGPAAYLLLTFCASTAPAQEKPHAVSTRITTAQVPFVGCESDGQVGPLIAPKGNTRSVKLPTRTAERLAYYQAKTGFGVLAPRGWHCFSTYGSNGSTLYVSPEAIHPPDLFSSDWHGFSSQVIQSSISVGGTSGRFSVARVIARVFPTYKAFVQDVIAEGIEPASSFPAGPYTADKLIHRSKSVIEFETPANSKGLGTDSLLQINSDPIRGVVLLFGAEPSLLHVSARLSPNNRDLTQTILTETEDEAAHLKNQ